MASAKRRADRKEAWDGMMAIGYEGKLCGEGVDPDDRAKKAGAQAHEEEPAR